MIYFTDGYGGLRHTTSDPRNGLDFNGIYMLEGGKVCLIINEVPSTNKLAFSPDQKILYADGSRDRYVKRYDALPDDTVSNGRMPIDMNGDPAKGITDGLRVGVRGDLWETDPGGVLIITPEGKHIGTIATPELAANVEFGDTNRKTLYIAARTSIYKIRLDIAGLP